MANESEAERKDFILEAIQDPAGGSLMSGQSPNNDAALQAEREKIWKDFVAQFTKS